MTYKKTNNELRLGRAGFAVSAFLALIMVPSVFAQDTETTVVTPDQQPQATVPAPAQANAPLVDDIHGITLGMTTDEVKDKLGKPDTSDATSMFYELKNGEQVQLRLDADKKVAMVSGIYLGAKADAPEFSEVFGTNVQPVQPQNGKIYRLIRYPESGYWVAYSKLDLDSGPMTTVTIQEMEK